MNRSPIRRRVAFFPILFVVLTLGGVEALSTVPVNAKTQCRPTPNGTQCTSQVNFSKFAQTAFKTQDKSQWCWAAAISMLFSYYDHPVNQSRIVTSLYGTTVNLPSGPGWNIASRVNADWIDENKVEFHARLTAAYDFDAGVSTLNNSWLVNELDQDRPFIVGTNGHAVVATAIQYFVTPMGPNVTSVGVFDPWPGRGARGLTQAEMLPMHNGGLLRFMATVSVED